MIAYVGAAIFASVGQTQMPLGHDLHLRITVADHRALREIAARDGVSEAFIIRRLIRQFVLKQTAQPPQANRQAAVVDGE